MAVAILSVAVILALLGFALLFYAVWKGATTPLVPYTPWLVEMLKRWSRSDSAAGRQEVSNHDDYPESDERKR